VSYYTSDHHSHLWLLYARRMLLDTLAAMILKMQQTTER
jgi:hypothetical protein